MDQDAFLGLHEHPDRCVHDLNLAVCLKQAPDLQRKVNSIEEDLMDIKAMAGKILQLIHLSKRPLSKPWRKFRDFNIDSNEILFDSNIGRGTFGEVWKAKWNSEVVAVKKLVCSDFPPKALKNLKREARILKAASHRHIARFYGLLVESHQYVLVLEYFPRQCLRTVLDSSFDHLTWAIKERIAQNVAAGMAFLHRNGILHRDLKSLNVVVSDDWLRGVAASFRRKDFSFGYGPTGEEIGDE
ncbi:kinase-like domain-containing protein [Paraphysoderma sedebokerense]|nr:kinase-like domain-containing protein [Paraphysoderma sedebokerense]